MMYYLKYLKYKKKYLELHKMTGAGTNYEIILNEFIIFKIIKDNYIISESNRPIKTSIFYKDIEDKTFKDIFDEYSEKITKIIQIPELKHKILYLSNSITYENGTNKFLSIKSLNKPDKLKRIKNLNYALQLDGFTQYIQVEFIKLYKKSLDIGNYVIVNSYSYNIGSKGIDQQMNMDLLPYSEGHIDLYLIDPNFGEFNDFEEPQLYDSEGFIHDKYFNVIIQSNPSKIIRKYDNEKKNLTIYTIPMMMPDISNLSKISNTHYISSHPKIMLVTFSYFDDKTNKLIF